MSQIYYYSITYIITDAVIVLNVPSSGACFIEQLNNYQIEHKQWASKHKHKHVYVML